MTHHGGTHRGKRTRLYGILAAMKSRCSNPNVNNYQYYGGKGIRVCGAWESFVGFLTWAMSAGYKDGLTIDRIDSSGQFDGS
jgi:hypothetical protein